MGECVQLVQCGSAFNVVMQIRESHVLACCHLQEATAHFTQAWSVTPGLGLVVGDRAFGHQPSG